MQKRFLPKFVRDDPEIQAIFGIQSKPTFEPTVHRMHEKRKTERYLKIMELEKQKVREVSKETVEKKQFRLNEIRKCERCGKEYKARIKTQKFCSHDCAYPKPKCWTCGRIFERQNSKGFAHFCGPECEFRYRLETFRKQNEEREKARGLEKCT